MQTGSRSIFLVLFVLCLCRLLRGLACHPAYSPYERNNAISSVNM